MLLLGPLLPLASAAVVTEVPPFLRGDIDVSYSYEQLSGSLQERGEENTEVGSRTLSDHMLHYGLVFSVAPGVAVFADVPHYVSSRVSYGALSEMVYDPSTGSGTYVGTSAGEPGTYVEGNGLGGIWFGVRGTPFSESFEKRNSRVTWLLEGAIRTGDPTSFWVSADDKRGAGPGGTAARVHTAFSTTFGSSSPYVSGTYIGEGKQTVTVTSPDGTVGESEVEIDPANHGEIRIGTEIQASNNKASGSMLAFDLHLAVQYHAWGQIPSGFYLPNVLEVSEGGPVQQAEALDSGGGLALHWRAFTNFQLTLYGDVAYHMPQRLEYPYPVYTGGDTLLIKAGTDLSVRFR
jgi:hypothetical protein